MALNHRWTQMNSDEWRRELGEELGREIMNYELRIKTWGSDAALAWGAWAVGAFSFMFAWENRGRKFPLG